jgi:flagellar protein FliL
MRRRANIICGAFSLFVAVQMPLSSFAQGAPDIPPKTVVTDEGEVGVGTPEVTRDGSSPEVEDEEGEGHEGEGSSSPEGSIYVPFKPPIVVNYGGSGRLKYIKVDISVRVQNSEAAASVQHHMPQIRNNLVMLLSAQTEESIGSQEGKEALRKEALSEVRQVIKTEDRREGVIDLYFNAFLIQQ